MFYVHAHVLHFVPDPSSLCFTIVRRSSCLEGAFQSKASKHTHSAERLVWMTVMFSLACVGVCESVDPVKCNPGCQHSLSRLVKWEDINHGRLVCSQAGRVHPQHDVTCRDYGNADPGHHVVVDHCRLMVRCGKTDTWGKIMRDDENTLANNWNYWLHELCESTSYIWIFSSDVLVY